MTTKQWKKLCRIRANKIAKFITCLMMILIFCIAEYFLLSVYVTAVISTPVWFYLPDLAVYLLECRYKLTHDHISYR